MGKSPVPLSFVTGATGFVGTRLVRALLARGERVRALGRNQEVLNRLAIEGAETICGDLRNRETIQDACRGVQTVYHVGALSVPWGITSEFVSINVDGTKCVLAGCQEQGVHRMIYVSSPSVAFDGEDCVRQTEAAPYPTRFVSMYSHTKAEGEKAVQAAPGNFERVIIRPKAVFGPGDTALLPRLIRAAERGRLPQIGDGNNRVDLTYIDNVIHALLLASEIPEAAGNTYTITNGDENIDPPCLWAVICQVLRTLNIPTNLRPVPLSLALLMAGAMEAVAIINGKEPLLTRYSALILARTQTYDISAAKRDLGYNPLVSLSEGLERTIAAYAHERRQA